MSTEAVVEGATGGKQHPLHRRWTLWYDSPSTYNTEKWELCLVPIMTVSTVEEFFLMLKFIKPLSVLRTASQYHFFQEGIKPMWEDPANQKGGKLWVNIDATASYSTSSQLDGLWETVLMALVGECLEDADSEDSQIAGVVIAKRKYVNRLSVWIKDASDEVAIGRLKEKIIKETTLPSGFNFAFSKHGESRT